MRVNAFPPRWFRIARPGNDLSGGPLELRSKEAVMMSILRILAACAVLVFYLPVISGIALAIVDAAGWSPGALTIWWKQAGSVAADAIGLSTTNKETMFTLWGLAALLAVVGHTLLSISRAWMYR